MNKMLDIMVALDILFLPGHFASCPVCVESLQLSGTDALVNPSRIKDYFSLFSSVLTIQTLPRLLIRVNYRTQMSVDSDLTQSADFNRVPRMYGTPL